MNRMLLILAALALAAVPGSYLLLAQQPAAPAGAPSRGPAAPPQPMSFFITSAPKGDGANYGGLAGADAYCQQLGAAAGRGGVTWHAYLSTQGAGAVNARDRIGNGPWYDANGAMNVGRPAFVYTSDEVQKAHRRAATGTSLRHSGHFFVVGSGGASPRFRRALIALMGTTMT